MSEDQEFAVGQNRSGAHNRDADSEANFGGLDVGEDLAVIAAEGRNQTRVPATNSEFVADHVAIDHQKARVSDETNLAQPEDLVDQPKPACLTPNVDQATIFQIREQWRRRQQWHRAEKSLTLQAKALCRRLAVDGDKREADAIYKAALGKGEHPQGLNAFGAIFPLVDARDGIEKHRKKVEKELAKLAGQLRVAPFVIATRGVGIASLAAVVGEAGDLANYGTVSRLWKRMGLAVMLDGTRQRRISGDAAIEHGYNPARRSVVWNIGACIVKAGGPLKALYDERKILELTRVETKAHAHNRAQRYVEKRFLRMLWAEWRRAIGGLYSNGPLLAADHFSETP